MKFVKQVSPKIAKIIKKIDKHFMETNALKNINDDKLKHLRILQGNTVHMAHMACLCSTHINGVAKLHTDLLKTTVLNDFYNIFPEKFINVTNGITQRR